MTLACIICSNTTWLMFTVAGSKRTGAKNEVVCSGCHKKWRNYEVELPEVYTGASRLPGRDE